MVGMNAVVDLVCRFEPDVNLQVVYRQKRSESLRPMNYKFLGMEHRICSVVQAGSRRGI